MMEIVKIQTDEEKVVSLVNILNKSANEYYNNLTPSLTDAEYDNMLERLAELEEKTGIQLANSPVRRVGFEVLNTIPKKVLPRKMLSLDKIKDDYKKLHTWINGKTRLIKEKSCVLTLKLDGLSCMLEYKEGKLIGCYTRGNGVEGSNVTEIVKTLSTVPNQLPNNFTGLVIGEVIIRESNFKKVNKSQEEKGLDTFANSRNLAAGTLLSLDTRLGRERGLEFIAFDLFTKNEDFELQEKKLLYLKEVIGFNIPNHFTIETNNIEEIEHKITTLRREASLLGLPIDGIVIGLNSVADREKCGTTSKFPLSSIAYKFEDEYEMTTIRDIEMSMSRTGTLTPVAIFDTIILDGTEVSRASLHNISILRGHEIGIGDQVKVIKANQIIPQITENLTKSDTYELPTECPYCGSELRLEGKTSLELVCNNEYCSEQQVLKINHMLSKNALDIKGISEQAIRKLMSLGEIENIYDLLDLPSKREKLIKANYPSFGRKSINNMCDSIEKGRVTTLDRFLVGLGIPNVGSKTARDISEKFKTIENVLNMDKNSLVSIRGIGECANNIVKDVQSNKNYINSLLEYIKIEIDNKTPKHGNNLKNIRFCITGKLVIFKKRSELEEFIINKGGKIVSSISSNTDYLVNNDPESNSSKNKKAKQQNIKIISERELVNFARK